MPVPVAGLAIGAIARTAAGGAARSAMTTSRFGLKSASRSVTTNTLGRSLSSSQFSGTDSNINITGPAVHEMLGRTPQ
jgi:hypothetical protein